MTKKQKRWRNRILVALVLFASIYALELAGIFDATFGHTQAIYIEFVLFLIPFLIAGYDVLIDAWKNLRAGHGLDENFLMSIATIGAFALVFFPDSEPHMAEGAAVMLFYQVGELFQSYAVGKSRKSISDMMDIVPEFANVEREGQVITVDPAEVAVGDLFIVKPGERVPLDGIVESGESQLETSALTGESVPRTIRPGDEIISGCVNLSATLKVKAIKPYEDSTVNRILELVENSAEKKARTENFITRFARYYTPIVVGCAALIALLPPLMLGGGWADWVLRGLTFLVVSCPCALVISVPLSFFGGIGGASRIGVLVKGSNYLEVLAKTDTVVFDKTGTLTSGTFEVTNVLPNDTATEQEVLEYAALGEAFSNHPIARSIQERYGHDIDVTRVAGVEEIPGHGIKATIDGKVTLIGNERLMYLHNIDQEIGEGIGTKVSVAIDGKLIGSIIVGDTIKNDARQAVEDLHAQGVHRTIMLSGDKIEVAEEVARTLGIDEVCAELLPQDKVTELENIMERDGVHVVFVGDGINDSPSLMRADVGIAMGAMGSDAAIEAADIVLMDDKPTQIACAIALARRTMRIVWQNIIFALGIKFAVLILAAFGIANMWMAVFADVGVAVLAILNAMRAMRIAKIQ